MFGLYWVTRGGGVALSGFSNVWIATEISKRIFPSVWLLVSLVALLLGPHEIMSTLFFETGVESSVIPVRFSCLFCLSELWIFSWILESLVLLLPLRFPQWFSCFRFDCEVRFGILRSRGPCDHGRRSTCWDRMLKTFAVNYLLHKSAAFGGWFFKSSRLFGHVILVRAILFL